MQDPCTDLGIKPEENDGVFVHIYIDLDNEDICRRYKVAVLDPAGMIEEKPETRGYFDTILLRFPS